MMILKFESNRVSHTIEAERFTVVTAPEVKKINVIVWPNATERTEEFMITPAYEAGGKEWIRCYVMNSNGKTIERICCAEAVS